MPIRVPRSVPPFFWPLGEGTEPPSPRPATAFGHDEGSWLYVDARRRVWSSPVTDGAPRLVNSTGTAFVDCMTVFADEWSGRSSLSDDEADAQTDRLHEALLRLDPAALTTPHAWWALILEQMREGLL